MNNLLLQYYGKFKLADGSLKDPENLVPFTQYIGAEFASSALAFTNNLVYYKETDPKVGKVYEAQVSLVEDVKLIATAIMNKSNEFKEKEVISLLDENVQFFFMLLDLKTATSLLIAALEKKKINLAECDKLVEFSDLIRSLTPYVAVMNAEAN